MKVENVIGLDLSLTSTGMVRVPVRGTRLHSWCFATAASMHIWARYKDIAQRIQARVGKNDLVLVENYAFGIKGAASRLVTLAELGGVVKMAVMARTRHWPIPVGSATLRKFATGTGKGSKDDIKLQVYKKDRQEFKTTDETDAYVIAQIGLCLIGAKPTFRAEWYGYEQECMTALIKSMDQAHRSEELHALSP